MTYGQLKKHKHKHLVVLWDWVGLGAVLGGILGQCGLCQARRGWITGSPGRVWLSSSDSMAIFEESSSRCSRQTYPIGSEGR
ncbi:hypothetical protein C2E23DRAFT_826817 [Lenzites betulinus]|nr:hypothetical protein C2E23DRAFT_826817 [Lenzites betulinus]